MPEGMDFIMRPVRAGMCKLESALDGTLDLYHFGLMNDSLDVDVENQRRVNNWVKTRTK
jgi:hypothetical protein